MKYKQVRVYCPQCHRRVGTYDGRSTLDKICKCKKCRKRVIYRIETGETEIKPLPPRTSGSGMMFV